MKVKRLPCRADRLPVSTRTETGWSPSGTPLSGLATDDRQGTGWALLELPVRTSGLGATSSHAASIPAPANKTLAQIAASADRPMITRMERFAIPVQIGAR